MAKSFDVSILVTEVGENQYMLILPFNVPAGVPLKEPTGGLFGMYRIIGPLEMAGRIRLPDKPVSKQEVVNWLQEVRKLSCSIYPGEFEVHRR